MWIEEAVAGEVLRGEEVVRESEESFAPSGRFEGEVEWLFGAMGDGFGEVSGSKGAPDHLVLTAGKLLGVGKGEGEVDEAVVEKGGAVFQAVGHRVAILADERPIGEPGGVLGGEEVGEGFNLELIWRFLGR